MIKKKTRLIWIIFKYSYIWQPIRNKITNLLIGNHTFYYYYIFSIDHLKQILNSVKKHS